MTNAKHTPAPWIADVSLRVRDKEVFPVYAQGILVAESPAWCVEEREPARANARLIAAAPDLAAALAGLVALADDPALQDDDAMAHPADVRDALDAARAALARAGYAS